MKYGKSVFIGLAAVMAVVCSPARADDAYRPYYLIDNPPPPYVEPALSPASRGIVAATDAIKDAQGHVTHTLAPAFAGAVDVQHDIAKESRIVPLSFITNSAERKVGE